VTLDVSYAKSQALVIRRIADRLTRIGESIKSHGIVDFGLHLKTEVGYLMDALDMKEDER